MTCPLASNKCLLGIYAHLSLSKNLEGLHMCYMCTASRYITYLLPFQVLSISMRFLEQDLSVQLLKICETLPGSVPSERLPKRCGPQMSGDWIAQISLHM